MATKEKNANLRYPRLDVVSFNGNRNLFQLVPYYLLPIQGPANSIGVGQCRQLCSYSRFGPTMPIDPLLQCRAHGDDKES